MKREWLAFEVFTFRGNDGTVRHWNVTAIACALVDGSLQSFEFAKIEIDDECYRAAAERGGVVETFVEKAAARLDVPIIVAIDDGQAILMDGNHRVVAAKRKGLNTLPAIVVQIGALTEFEIPDAVMGTP